MFQFQFNKQRTGQLDQTRRRGNEAADRRRSPLATLHFSQHNLYLWLREIERDWKCSTVFGRDIEAAREANLVNGTLLQIVSQSFCISLLWSAFYSKGRSKKLSPRLNWNSLLKSAWLNGQPMLSHSALMEDVSPNLTPFLSLDPVLTSPSSNVQPRKTQHLRMIFGRAILYFKWK